MQTVGTTEAEGSVDAAGNSGDGGDLPISSGLVLDAPGLAASISQVLDGGNGDYSVLLSMHPPELGEVQARLSLRGDLLQVYLSPEHPAAHDALEGALSTLREQLSQGGVDVDVTLGDPGARPDGAPAGGSPRNGPDTGRQSPDTAGSSPVASPTPPPGGGDRLHLVL